MQVKFKDAAEVFRIAGDLEARVEALRVKKAETEAEIVAVLKEGSDYLAMVQRVIEHNQRRPIIDGERIWLGPIQGCNATTRREAIWASKATLPDDLLAEAEPKPKPELLFEIGRRYREVGTGRIFTVERLWPGRAGGHYEDRPDNFIIGPSDQLQPLG
jgi:hypothetical protein